MKNKRIEFRVWCKYQVEGHIIGRHTRSPEGRSGRLQMKVWRGMWAA